MIKRKEAAERLQVGDNTLEVRKLKYATIYRSWFERARGVEPPRAWLTRTSLTPPISLPSEASASARVI